MKILKRLLYVILCIMYYFIIMPFKLLIFLFPLIILSIIPLILDIINYILFGDKKNIQGSMFMNYMDVIMDFMFDFKYLDNIKPK